MSLFVEGESVQHTENCITAQYVHRKVGLEQTPEGNRATISNTTYHFQTQRHPGRVGLMMVGLGGNNGSTILGGILANKHAITWRTKKGEQMANMLGSMTQSSSMKVADSEDGEVYMRLKEVIPMVDPVDLEVTGWDINKADLAEAMARAQVFDYDLQQKLEPYLKEYRPLPSIYYPDFIASNQEDRADNLLPGDDKWQHLTAIRKDIASFREERQLDKVIVLWTANTERFAKEEEGVNDTYDNLLKAVKNNHP